MKFNFCVIMSIFYCLFGCSSFDDRLPNYEKIADNITEKTAKKLKEQKNLCLVGTGGKL